MTIQTIEMLKAYILKCKLALSDRNEGKNKSQNKKCKTCIKINQKVKTSKSLSKK